MTTVHDVICRAEEEGSQMNVTVSVCRCFQRV